MYDFEDMIRRALANIGAGDAVVAMPYARPRRVMADLYAAGALAGFIADDAKDAAESPGAVGWWRDRIGGEIDLRDIWPRTLVHVGVEASYRFTRAFLLRALSRRPKGRLVSTDAFGHVIEDLTPPSFQALKRFISGGSPGPIADFVSGYDAIFEAIGEDLRLPTDAFDPRRVLFFIGSLGPGGAERQASYLAAELARRGDLDVHIACINLAPPGDFFLKDATSAGAKVFEMRRDAPELEGAGVKRAMARVCDEYHSLAMSTLLTEIVQCAHAIRTIRPGIVHTWMDFHNSLGGVAATLTGAPTLINSGRSMSPEHFRIFQPYMKPGYEAVMARRSVTILNNSLAGARDYERWLGMETGSIETIHNGFLAPDGDKPALRIAMRKELGLGERDVLVGSILRFSEEKRPDYLLSVAAEMNRLRPDVRFVLFGDGPMRTKLLEQTKSNGLAEIVLMPGRTDQAWKALAAMDLFMLASRMEGLPNVLVEAQLMGVPVICTGVGGMSETFVPGKTGVVAPGDSPALFAEAAIRLLSSPEILSQMSIAAAAVSRTEFSIRAMCDRTVAAYERASGAELRPRETKRA